jgi:hypothetical protein
MIATPDAAAAEGIPQLWRQRRPTDGVGGLLAPTRGVTRWPVIRFSWVRDGEESARDLLAFGVDAIGKPGYVWTSAKAGTCLALPPEPFIVV